LFSAHDPKSFNLNVFKVFNDLHDENACEFIDVTDDGIVKLVNPDE
jgi:hypothetical protein